MAKAEQKTELKALEPVNKEERETTMMFMDKIETAILNGDEWVETSPELIAHYNRKGLGPNEYFIFKNIKVCAYGKSEECQNKMDADLHRLMHGAQEARFEGRT